MGLNFRKSITILPGVRLNLSKSGVSCSFGKKGLRQTISTSGRATTSIGIPGTGVYYTKSANVKKVAKSVAGKFGKGKDEEAADERAVAKKSKGQSEEVSAEAKEALEEASKRVAEYEAYVDSIKSVHKATDGYIDWEALNKDEVPSNLVKGSEEYKEWENLKKFSERVLAGDIDSYFEVIDEVKPFDDLLEYGSAFEVGTDRADLLEVEFRVRSEEVVPKTSLTLKANGSVSEKDLTKTAYYDLMQDYVASTAIRIARDSFALLPVKTVIVHAVDNVLNTATGHEEETTLLSVEFKRDKLLTLNMEMIDPSDALSGFRCNMKFVKTTGFKPVERVLPE